MKRVAIILLLATAPLGAKEPAVNLTEPVAAALRVAYQDHSRATIAANSGMGSGREVISLCITSEVSLDFALLERRLAASHLRPVPVVACSSEQVDGRGTMFLPTYPIWKDESGNSAQGLEVTRVRCRSKLRCRVEIAWLTHGISYSVERQQAGWKVRRVEPLWVV